MRIEDETTCRTAYNLEGRQWTEYYYRTRRFDLGHAFIFGDFEGNRLRKRALREEEAARLERIAAADALREADGRSIFSRTPFGARMSLKNYRVKPASKQWIEANRI